jgi:hypothetical protein
MILPEVAETAATGSVADTYADIRAHLASPMVHLVYRHMATDPGCLYWAWSCLRPAFASGAVHDGAARLVARAPSAPAAPFSAAVLDDAGVDADVAATIAGLLDAYNRSNPLNVIALHLLSLILAEGFVADNGAAPAQIHSPSAAVAEPMSMPPMFDISTVDAATAAVLDRLAKQVDIGGGVVPTAYRYLAYWPGFLALAADTVDDLARTIDLDRATTEMMDEAKAVARALPRRDPGLAPPSAAQSERIRALIDSFPTSICRMIVIGAHLRRTLGD